MDYSTSFPPNYKSWISFYEVAKPYLLDGVDDLHWHVPLPTEESSSEPGKLHEYKYSVRFIEQQTLAELYALRKLQTFDFDELRYLHEIMQQALSNADSPDPKMKGLQKKVDELYLNEQQKQWETL